MPYERVLRRRAPHTAVPHHQAGSLVTEKHHAFSCSKRSTSKPRTNWVHAKSTAIQLYCIGPLLLGSRETGPGSISHWSDIYVSLFHTHFSGTAPEFPCFFFSRKSQADFCVVVFLLVLWAVRYNVTAAAGVVLGRAILGPLLVFIARSRAAKHARRFGELGSPFYLLRLLDTRT